MADDPTRPSTPPSGQRHVYLDPPTTGPSPRPLTSLVASAQRLTSRTLTRQGSNAKSWQEDAWEMYDLVGEQRFLASTLANRMSQARLYVGQIDANMTEAPVETDNAAVQQVLEAFGDSPAARVQLLSRLGINLFVAGDGWLCGIPKHLMPNSEEEDAPPIPPTPLLVDQSGLSIQDLQWRMLSVSEVTGSAGRELTLRLGETDAEQIKCSPDDIWLIRVWRPHPRRWWEADSPTRSSLPVLRELVGLTMHISAQVDSRLAGAGLLIIPQSAQRALQVAAGLPEDSGDQFTEALMEAMLKPIQDRSSASAYVPLVITVPDEATQLFTYLTFAKPLDAEARTLRDESIRRLALGQDAPPELLLGTSGMNHWGAWLVQEDVVTTHLEPPLALICDALTTQYLWPVLVDQGMAEEDAQNYVVWYDVSDLVVRPNHSTDALELHTRGVLSDVAVRAATGFDESDAPGADANLPTDVRMALELAHASPGLFTNPGLPGLVAQIRAVLNGEIPGYVDPNAASTPIAAEEEQPPEVQTEAPSVEGEPSAPDNPAPPAIPDSAGEPTELPGLAAGAVDRSAELAEVLFEFGVRDLPQRVPSDR